MAGRDWFPTFRKLADVRVSSETPFRSWWPVYSTAAQQHALLRLIAVAIEENLPLVPLLEKWAADEWGIQRRRLFRLVDLLKRGLSLPQALEEVPGLLREADLVALRFDAQLGTRTAALRDMLEQPRPTIAGSRVQKTLIYFCALLLVGIPLVLFVQTNILPVFVKILQEFSLPEPEAMGWSRNLASYLGQQWWTALALIALLVFLGLVLFTRLGRSLRNALFGSSLSPYRESLSADVLQKLAVALDAGRPIPGALSTLARYYFDPAIRHKLLFARNEVEHGDDLWQSMHSVGLLTAAELRLLNAADRVGNRSWVMRQLVRAKQRRTSQRLDRAGEFLLPLLVIVAGAWVLLQALTVFGPLTQLIQSLA